MLEIKRENKEHKARIFGEELTLREPSYKESRMYSKKVEGLDEAEQGDALIDFLEELGLPKSCSEEMTTMQITDVVELLMPSKKK